MVVNDTVVIAIRSREVLHPVEQAQLLSHLRLLNLPVGLLINFHVVILKDGIKRMILSRQDSVDEAELIDALR